VPAYLPEKQVLYTSVTNHLDFTISFRAHSDPCRRTVPERGAVAKRRPRRIASGRPSIRDSIPCVRKAMRLSGSNASLRGLHCLGGHIKRAIQLDRNAPRRLAVAPFRPPFQPQNLSNVSHGQSFRHHHALRRPALGQNGDGKSTSASLPRNLNRCQRSFTMRGIGNHARGTGDHEAVEYVITMAWNRRSRSCGAHHSRKVAKGATLRARTGPLTSSRRRP
jgi:hypothetical protein